MASCSRYNNGSLMFKPDRQHFLSIIRGDAIPLHKLEIPRKFVEVHGDDLPWVMMLKVPTGAKWPVKIVRRNGDIWLERGWREFAKYYSLVEGSSIVFAYEKRDSSQFNVIILDKSMDEIDYNISFSNGDSRVDDEEHSDSSVEILSSKPNLDSQAQEPAGRQRVNRSFTRKKAFTTEEKAKAIYVHTVAGRKSIHQSVTSKNIKITREEKKRTVKRAISNFRSKNPSFQMVIQPSYVQNKKVSPVIPLIFAKEHLKGNGDAILRVSDGTRRWRIQYFTLSSPHTATRIRNPGWRKFIQDNHLQVGDVCIFELLHVDKTEFKVTVSKYSNLNKSPAGSFKQSKEKTNCSKEPNYPSADCRKLQSVDLRSCDVIHENHTKKKTKV